VHPRRGWPGSVNDASIVLEVGWAGRRILLTGDIEHAGERALVAGGGLRAADVLKVAHHGSRTSSTPAFVRAARPAVAVVSVGAENRYGHPAPEVETRWRGAGACVLRTDVCGAVSVSVGADGSIATTTVEASCACGPGVLRARVRSPS
jgi:competence protein ComEC